MGKNLTTHHHQFMASVKLRPFFYYYGAKRRLAAKYPAPRHHTIIEPFAGAAGYSLEHHEHDVILVDCYDVISSLWDYLIHADPAEILDLPDLKSGQTTDDLDVLPNVKSLIGFWINQGVDRPRKTPSTWMRLNTANKAEIPESWWGPAARQRIASQLKHIRHWQVLSGSYEDLKNPTATWFIDPPYQGAGKYYVHRNIDYDHLGCWCRSRSGQVIVCENAGANWLPFESFYGGQLPRGSHRQKTRKEVIWVSARRQ